MKHLRIAILRGGPSNEYEVSMRTGANVLRSLTEQGYQTKDIVITRKGEWLDSGIVRKPEHALEGIDRVFIALHGEYGEDGTVQRFLQTHSIPFTGSDSFSSSVAFNKAFAKDRLKNTGIKTPKHIKVSRADISRLNIIVDQLNSVLGEELFIKPITGGSSIGAKYAPTKSVVKESIEFLLKEYEEVIVEEFVRGKEATVAVLENFRNEPLYILPAIEIVPPAGEPMFSYENKYNNKTAEICPGRFSYHEKAKLEEAARQVHKTLGCRHYSRSDFIIRNGEVYFLELNTLPGLTNESLLPKSALAIGLSYDNLIEHIVSTALGE